MKKKSERRRFKSLPLVIVGFAIFDIAAEGITVFSVLIAIALAAFAFTVATRSRERNDGQQPVSQPEPPAGIPATGYLPTLVGLSAETFERVVLPRLAKRQFVIKDISTLKRVSRLHHVLLAPLFIGVLILLSTVPLRGVNLPRGGLSTSSQSTTTAAAHQTKPPVKHPSHKKRHKPLAKHPPPKRRPRQNSKHSPRPVTQTERSSSASHATGNTAGPRPLPVWWLTLGLGGVFMILGIPRAFRWLWTFWFIDEVEGVFTFFLPPGLFIVPDEGVFTRRDSLLGGLVHRSLLGKLLGYGSIRVQTLLDVEEEKPFENISPLPDAYGFANDLRSLLSDSTSGGPLTAKLIN